MKADGSLPADMPAGPPAGMTGMPSGMPTGGGIQGMPAAELPAGETSKDLSTKTVWLKDEKMGVRPSVIKIGIDNGSAVEVISGLKEGDEVVISMGNSTAKTTAKRSDNGPPGGFPF